MQTLHHCARQSARHTIPLRALAFAAALVASAWIAPAVADTGVELVALAAPVPAPTAHSVAGRSIQETLPTIEVQGSYDALTRRQLLAVARYPNNADARLQQLRGKVAVEFELDRQGGLRDATVAQSSKSRILDAAALASVHWANYAPFPPELAASESARRYRVTFDYRFGNEK